MVEELGTRSRRTELLIKGHLYELQEINDEVLGGRQGYPMSEQGYKATLVNVSECADLDVVDEVAEYIKESIQDNGERPKNRKIRRVARTKVTEAGYPANSYLNAA
ncbi:hypothetical protein [Natronoarchaeum rubrum]|uniref:hypothetical protein n=1 Tax=Natronoarchaeum rubrum TaxID=755311 RepID=UPI002111B6E9|nr:hypothetical protein [Natronoarchaeum rubrum]